MFANGGPGVAVGEADGEGETDAAGLGGSGDAGKGDPTGFAA
jgi:hypothetical protein